MSEPQSAEIIAFAGVEFARLNRKLDALLVLAQSIIRPRTIEPADKGGTS